MFSQQIAFEKIEKMNSNSDKFLYKVSKDQTSSEFLADLNVQGYSNNDAEVFKAIYKKAKEVGANSFSLSPFLNVDGSETPFSQHFYRLALYYTKLSDIDQNNNQVYFLNPSEKTVKISYDGKVISLEPRSYYSISLEIGKISSVSTRKFLGSGLKLTGNANQPEQFFVVSGSRIQSNPYGTAGINFKTGDFIPVERSYGDFLTTIYHQIQP